MRLNRKHRTKPTRRRPTPDDTPQQQMKAFLAAPGKLHIVQLPDDKSFVLKVTDDEMPIFATICQQLRGVLGYCDAIPATPVEAHVADAQEIAEQTAAQTKQQRIAQQAASESGPKPDTEQFNTTARRSGKHRAQQPDTAFDQLVNAGPATTDEGTRRLAALRIAAAQDELARAQDSLDEATDRLAAAYEHGREIHNHSVLQDFTQRAGQAITDNQPRSLLDDPNYNPQWHMTGPGSFTLPDDVRES